MTDSMSVQKMAKQRQPKSPIKFLPRKKKNKLKRSLTFSIRRVQTRLSAKTSRLLCVGYNSIPQTANSKNTKKYMTRRAKIITRLKT